MNYTAILQCEYLSAQRKILVPEVVKCLLATEVDSYHVDLVAKRITYFDVYNQSLHVPLSLQGLPMVSAVFNAQAVARAVRRSQCREIDYSDYVTEIMLAGVANYTAYLNCGRVQYCGVDGQVHVENFPTFVE